MKNNEPNQHDYLSVAVGCGHNIGAAGVTPIGRINLALTTNKRSRQCLIRWNRSLGYNS